MSTYSTFLFATPSAWRGVGSLIDLAGTAPAFNRSSGNAAADSRALRADTLAVMQDGDDALQELLADQLQ